MKAVQTGRPGAAELVEVPEPHPGPGEVLVEVESAALCPTDRRLVARGADPPRVLGHELAGRLADGTTVGVHPDVGCERCPECRSGLENRCRTRVSIGLDRDGGFAELVAVPAAHAIPLNGVDVRSAPLLEPLACCLHAVSLLAVREGDRALVVGAGPMGILSTWALQAAGVRVVLSQRSPERRALARELGADAVVAPDEDPGKALGGEPRVAVVAATGAQALEWTLGKVAVGGAVHVFAGTPGGARIDANLVHYRHLSLVGSTGSTLADYTEARDLVVAGAIDLSRLPNTRIPLERVPEALASNPNPRRLKIFVDVKGG